VNIKVMDIDIDDKYFNRHVYSFILNILSMWCFNRKPSHRWC